MELKQGKSLTTCEGGEVCPQYSHWSIQAQTIDSFNDHSLTDCYVPGSVGIVKSPTGHLCSWNSQSMWIQLINHHMMQCIIC